MTPIERLEAVRSRIERHGNPDDNSRRCGICCDSNLLLRIDSTLHWHQRMIVMHHRQRRRNDSVDAVLHLNLLLMRRLKLRRIDESRRRVWILVTVERTNVFLELALDGSRVRTVRTGEVLLSVDLDDVLAQGLLRDEHLTTLGAWNIAYVAVHLDVVVEAALLVRCETALITFHHQHLLVHQHLMAAEEVSCAEGKPQNISTSNCKFNLYSSRGMI